MTVTFLTQSHFIYVWYYYYFTIKLKMCNQIPCHFFSRCHFFHLSENKLPHLFLTSVTEGSVLGTFLTLTIMQFNFSCKPDETSYKDLTPTMKKHYTLALSEIMQCLQFNSYFLRPGNQDQPIPQRYECWKRL